MKKFLILSFFFLALAVGASNSFASCYANSTNENATPADTTKTSGSGMYIMTHPGSKETLHWAIALAVIGIILGPILGYKMREDDIGIDSFLALMFMLCAFIIGVIMGIDSESGGIFFLVTLPAMLGIIAGAAFSAARDKS